MLIGIPKEIMHKENRVAALPETVEKFIKLGFEVLVETKAGAGLFVDDAIRIRLPVLPYRQRCGGSL
jgi:H+-translocating NAD(P) transhydrogenase subunit alpha